MLLVLGSCASTDDDEHPQDISALSDLGTDTLVAADTTTSTPDTQSVFSPETTDATTTGSDSVDDITTSTDTSVVDVEANDISTDDLGGISAETQEDAFVEDALLNDIFEDDAPLNDVIPIDAGPSEDTAQATCIDQQFTDQLAQLTASTCSLCHTKEGLAASSNLQFASLHEAVGSARDAINKDALVTYLMGASAPQIIYEKPTGALPHGGGQVLLETSLEADALKSFVESLTGSGGCDAVALPVLDPASFELASPEHTLWLATRLLIDRAPTPEEIAQVADDIDNLDAVLLTYYKTEAFAERIAQIYEDDLHTNMFFGRNNSFFIQRAWGMVEDSQGNKRGNYRWMDDYDKPQGDEWKALLVNSAHGFGRSARELIKYVVSNKADFGEILTANYTMVNAYSVRTYAAEKLLPADSPITPAENSKVDRTVFVPVVLDEVPTAGLLSDMNFLATYPTTPVNLNRNRSREVHDHFLATDILALSNRAILDFGDTQINPTYNNSACVVCHNIMDPISGAYQNWPRVSGTQGVYDPLNKNAQLRWDSTDPNDQLHVPGATNTQAVPANNEDQSLQWLAKHIVDDPRFGLSVAHAVYEGLTGRTPLMAPRLGSKDYEQRLRAFQLERQLLEATAQAFVTSQRNLGVLVTTLIKSPLIRTISTDSGEGAVLNTLAASRMGLDKMPYPEDLERKLKAATGFSWYSNYAKTDAGESNYHWNNHIDRPGRSLLVEFRESCGNGGHGCYARWYSLLGGLDINPVGGNDTRPTVPNVVIAAIFSRLAIEMPWRLVAREFSIQSKKEGLFARTLFPLVDLSTVPMDEEGTPIQANVDAILANIQHLFLQLHGHKRALDDVEVQAAYTLFVDVWKLGLQKGKQLGFSERVDQPELDALAAYEATMGKPFIERLPVNKDHFNTVRAWRLVLDYMLSDPAFLYDQIDGTVAP